MHKLQTSKCVGKLYYFEKLKLGMPTLSEFCSKGVEEVLLYLYEEQLKITRGERAENVSAKELTKKSRVSSGKLYPVLIKKLKEPGLIEQVDGKYAITLKGKIFVETIIRDSRLILGSGNSDCTDIGARDVANEAEHVARDAHNTLYLTSRNLSSLEDKDVNDIVNPTFKKLHERGVTVSILLDPSTPTTTEDLCVSEWHAKVRFIPSSFLAQLPGILSPIELNDFSHVLIADESSWLYLKQHMDETEHQGKRCFKDITTGSYLAKIFRTLWMIASSDRDKASYLENIA
jgi:sugar-specific transcriptional regulator TrmB